MNVSVTSGQRNPGVPPMQFTDIPERPLDKVQIDFCGQFQPSVPEGNEYVLAVQYVFTRFTLLIGGNGSECLPRPLCVCVWRATDSALSSRRFFSRFLQHRMHRPYRRGRLSDGHIAMKFNKRVIAADTTATIWRLGRRTTSTNARGATISFMFRHCDSSRSFAF